MLGDVKLVVHQLGGRKLLRHSIGIGWKHVGGDRPSLLLTGLDFLYQGI